MNGKFFVLGALLLTISAVPASAQRVVTRGVVDRIDATSGMVTLRMPGGTRDIVIDESANLRINGRYGTLGEIMYNASLEARTWRNQGGRLHADDVRVTQPLRPTRLAAVQPGSVINGEVVGLNPNAGQVVLRTPTGFRTVALGTAPIMLNGRPVTMFDLAIGDTLQVQQPTPRGGSQGVPTMAVVTTQQSVAGMRQTFRNTAQ